MYMHPKNTYDQFILYHFTYIYILYIHIYIYVYWYTNLLYTYYYVHITYTIRIYIYIYIRTYIYIYIYYMYIHIFCWSVTTSDTSIPPSPLVIRGHVAGGGVTRISPGARGVSSTGEKGEAGSVVTMPGGVIF